MFIPTNPFFPTLPLAFGEQPFRREPATASADSDIYTATPDARAATVRAALDAGITLFHARYEREAQSLGESLRRLGIRAEVTVSTTDGDVLDRCPDTEDGAKQAILGAIARKRQLLGVDVLDVFSLFDVRPDVHTPARLAGARMALDEARAAGQIVRVGAACDAAFDFLAGIIAADSLPLDCVTARFCFPAQSAAARLFPVCQVRDITTLAAHTFSWYGGVPFVRFPNTWRYRNLTKNFYGFTAAQAHLHWVLRQPNIDGILVSMQTPAQVSENVAATQIIKEPEGIESLFESFVDAITKTKEGWRGLLTDEQWEYRAAAEARLSRPRKLEMIDLSSDTATKPSEGMRRAMAAAPVGDEQKHEDPTTNELQERAADLLGKEAAMFLPSATMANLVALKMHLKPGDELIASRNAHILNWQGGGYAAVAGATVSTVDTQTGLFTAVQVEAAIRPNDPHFPQTRLVCLENTHNAGGGTVWSRDQLQDVREAADRHGLAVHLDGARLLNAAAASGLAPRAIAEYADTTALCLSKGLGCPVGAILAGPRDFIEAAWRVKHVLGGAMRQSGVLAAAGLYALKYNMARLPEDHLNARRLAEGLAGIESVQIDVSRVQSNILFFTVEGMSGDEARRQMEERGVRLSGGYGSIRAVTHLDVSAQDIEQAIEAAQAAWG